MIKQISRLEHMIGDRVYHLLVDSDSPLSEVKEACYQFLAYCVKVEEAVKAQQAQQEVEQPKEEEAPSEGKEEAQVESHEAS